jgi:hypothetical protein
MAVEASELRRNLLSGLFASGDTAERAYEACVKLGYEIGDVNVVVSEDTRRKLLESHDEGKVKLAEHKSEGGELGGPAGGRTGILITIVAAVGAAVAIPTVGIVIGPIAVALAAAGAAGAAAGLISAFADWGVPPQQLQRYEEDVRDGAILVVVETRSEGDARLLASEWKTAGGREIQFRTA